MKNYFCFRFLWISRRPGTLYWERVFFWLSKNLYKQCEFKVQNQRDFVPSLDLKEDSMLKMSPILGIQFSNKAVTIFTCEINMYKVSSIKLIGNSRSNSPSVLELSILIELTFWKVMLSFDIFFQNFKLHIR